MTDLSTFPADSKVPGRLRALVSGRGPKRVRIKMEEAGNSKDPRRNDLADFAEKHDLQVFFDPFADVWTVSLKQSADLFEEASNG